MKISVIIPAFNEEKTIGKVLDKVSRQTCVGEVIVVNDGSSDKTSAVVESHRVKNKKIRLVIHQTNKGKGMAIRTGIKNARKNYVLIQDADLEYDPGEYKLLLKNVNEKTIVYGSRMLGGNPHAYLTTYIGNLVLTSLNNFLFSTKLTDIYTCYKLIPLKVLKGMNLKSSGFEMEAEITAKALKKGLKIIEVPISYKPRTYEKGKKIKAKDAIIGILTLLKIRFVS